ncbi:MAG: AraC family transcriptional regulator [Lachnospiraceae bacterium]|nr:AraC family transcriptional regulator [Lachnospiraceae bacterium]MDE7417411.1 AraC family transcriptional regulator [Lachnospiraceae bacterium]
MGILQEWYVQELADSERDTYHRPLNDEQLFFNAVSSGDIDFVRENCRQQKFAETEGVGTLSRDAVTNLKYHFVITTAFVTRLCIGAGMELEQAFRLSDFYILKLDNLHTCQAVIDLHDHMVLDFTGKMRIMTRSSGMSRPITLCVDYIYAHIKERITIEDLAEYTELSASYLSRLFKKETGVSVSDYVREKKIEKAQHLLKFCDYGLVEIANYLSFSSQSHFIQLFKDFTGITPKKYRDLYSSSVWDVSSSKKQDTAPL